MNSSPVNATGDADARASSPRGARRATRPRARAMDASESDSDAYETVGYADARERGDDSSPRARKSSVEHARASTEARDARARSAPAVEGFDWDDVADEDEGRVGAVESERGRGGEGTRAPATPEAEGRNANAATPRRSPRFGGSGGGGEGEGGVGTPSPGARARRAREEALVAEALGVNAARAEAAARAIRGGGERAGGGGRAKPKAAKPRRGVGAKSKAKGEASPKRQAKRAKPAPTRQTGGVLGRLTLLTQSVARPTETESVVAEAPSQVMPSTVARASVAADVEQPMEDDIDDEVDASSHDSSASEDEAPLTAAPENDENAGGLGALSRLPKMSSPTFLPRSSVGASVASQRNRARNAGTLTARLQRVMQNARLSHAQFLKRVAANQPPSSRGALLFTVNSVRLDASLTNCAGSVCDLHRATSDDYDEADVSYSRAIVLFNSTQSQELGLERGRRVAIYPPWREIDLAGRVDAATGSTDELVPRVIVCCENVLKLD